MTTLNYSPIDEHNPTIMLEFFRSMFGAKQFSRGDCHHACVVRGVPLDFIQVSELLRQAAERNLLTRTKRDGQLSYTFKAQIHG